jgi:hypothetical protein
MITRDYHPAAASERSGTPRYSPAIVLLSSYPAFAFLRWRHLPLNNSLPFWNTITVCCWAALLSVSSILDRTIWMPGRSTGFLEHPGILIFLLAQLYAPLNAVRSLDHLLGLRMLKDGPLSGNIAQQLIQKRLSAFELSVLRDNASGRGLYRFLVLIGFGVFVWNSYQNQLPVRFLGFDFWDSVYHPFGYWTTRIYKFYLWVLLIPALGHLIILSVWTVRRFIVSTSQTGAAFTLEPYHEDGCGGIRILVDSILNPLVPVVVVTTSLSLAAFLVHEKLDVTTIGGFTLGGAFFLLIYLNPAITLRKLIRSEKRRQIKEIRKKQSDLYFVVRATHTPSQKASDAAQVITSLSEVCKHVSSLPNWPQFDRVVRLATLAWSSPLIGWALKQAANWTKSNLSIPWPL